MATTRKASSKASSKAAKQTKKTATKAPPAAPSAVIQGYLFLYNTALFFLWGYVLYVGAAHFIASGMRPTGLVAAVMPALIWAQTVPALEVAHAMLGFVRSPVSTTAMQLWTRLVLVCVF